MGVFIYIFAVILISYSFIAYKFRIRAMGYINLLSEDLGCFSLRVNRLCIVAGYLKRAEDNLTVTFRSQKTRKIKLNLNKSDKDSVVSYLDNAALRVVEIIKINLFFKQGISDDAGATAIMLGATSIALSGIHAFLKAGHPNIRFSYDTQTDFHNDVFQVSLDCILLVSIADIIISFFIAVLYKIKKRKNK